MSSVNIPRENSTKRTMTKEKNPLIHRVIGVYIKLLDRISSSKATNFVEKLFHRPNSKKLTVKDRQFLTQGEKNFINFNNYSIFVASYGQGPIILLAHGWGSHSLRYKFIISELVEGGFKVIAFDFVAHGQSSGKQTSLIEGAKLIKLLSDKYKPFAVLSYSLGGLSSIIAIENGLFADKFVFLNTPSQLTSVITNYKNMLGFSNAIEEKFISRLENKYGKSVQSFSAVNIKFDASKPALIVNDIDDQIVPHEDGNLLAERWENSILVKTSSLGHKEVIRNQKVVDQIIEFLRSDRSSDRLL